MAQRKILIITNRVPFPLNDGGNLAMNAMIEGYHNAGWQVFLLAMNTSRHFVMHHVLKELFTHLHAFEWVDVNNDLKWTQLLKNYFFSSEPEHAVRFYKEAFEQKIISVLASFEPDVIQAESVYLATYLPAIAEHSPALTVLRVHNIEYQVWHGLSGHTKSWLKAFYLKKLTVRVRNFERAAWKEFDLVLAITEKDANMMMHLEDLGNLVVAPFSLDTDKIKPGKDEKWVGFHIGAMDWIPNRDGIKWFLSRAWPKIHKAVPEFEFYFAGRNMPDEFRQFNASGIHCVDDVPDAEAFIADKKILIVPIKSSGGIRVKILEAMAAGKVVITTKSGIKGIEARAGEHFLLANSTDEITKAVKWCMNNKALAEKMAEHARDLIAEKYDHKKVMNIVIEEVEALLQKKG